MWRAWLLASLCGALFAVSVDAQNAAALRARHVALEKEFAHNPFGRPLHVESSVSGSAHKGGVYAVLGQPYSVVGPALGRAGHWCDILVLQVNVKRCEGNGEALAAYITRNARDAVESAHSVEFRFGAIAAGADYLHVTLASRSGPMGTRDFEIRLEAAPLDSRRTFIHMSYSYVLGFMARNAMDAYLAGSGRDMRGFTVVERLPDGKPVYVDGVRGVIERSAIRYYVAIEAYLDSLAAPEPERLDRRLRSWYAGTQRYPQLREPVGADEYVEMKRREVTG